MNDPTPRTPERLTAENALICEKLLGWTIRGTYWWTYEPKRDEQIARCKGHTPSFTTWANAGLILDAMQAKGKAPLVYSHELNARWEASFAGHPMMFGDTGPLAIRYAALEYIKAVMS